MTLELIITWPIFGLLSRAVGIALPLQWVVRRLQVFSLRPVTVLALDPQDGPARDLLLVATRYRNPSRSRSRSPSPRYLPTRPKRRREHFAMGESWSSHPSPPRSAPTGEGEAQRGDHVVAADDTTTREKTSLIPHSLTKEINKWGVVSINPDESKAIRDTLKLNF